MTELEGLKADMVVVDDVLAEAGEIKPVVKTKAQRMIEQQYAKQSMNAFVHWKMSKRGR